MSIICPDKFCTNASRAKNVVLLKSNLYFFQQEASTHFVKLRRAAVVTDSNLSVMPSSVAFRRSLFEPKSSKHEGGAKLGKLF